MAFRFKLGESFEDGFRRIALEQVDRASSQLQHGDKQDVAIHETRKGLKRVRALLQLMRPAIGNDTFKSENALIRDIGLSLSGARDRDVLLATAAKLDTAGRRAVGETIKEAILASNGKHEPLPLKVATEQLAAARKRLSELTVAGAGFDVIGQGLENSYRRARKAMRHAYEEPSDEAFHEWRKGTQRHWRQMALLSRAWPACLEARVSEARELSQLLGDDHDLAVLVAFLHSEAAAGISEEVVAVAETAARAQQEQLRLHAKPRGERLFAAKPRRLRDDIAAYWEAALRLKDLENPPPPPPKPKPLRKPGAPRRRSRSTPAKP